MNKELTPLEALKRLYDFNDLPSRNMIAYLLEQENLQTYYKIIEKPLKALEIIKEHYVKIGGTRGNFEGKKPTNEIVIALKDLTREDFEMLKEVL